MRKEIERQEVERSTVIERALENAISNAFRKKGKRPVELWKKRRHEPSGPPVTREEFDALRAAFMGRAR